jgi:uncharacterized protein YodC (DUF2158 family)
MSDNLRALETKRESIAPGSIVELKTGGPSMAVETRTPEKAYCVWHNHEGDLLRDWVPIVCLKVKP